MFWLLWHCQRMQNERQTCTILGMTQAHFSRLAGRFTAACTPKLGCCLLRLAHRRPADSRLCPIRLHPLQDASKYIGLTGAQIIHEMLREHGELNTCAHDMKGA